LSDLWGLVGRRGCGVTRPVMVKVSTQSRHQ